MKQLHLSHTGTCAERTVSLLLAMLAFVTSVHAQPLSAVMEHELLRAQDLRDAAKIRIMLQADAPALVERAAIAAGSLQDTILIPQLQILLWDREPAIRSAAAFALGQTGAAADTGTRRELTFLLIKRLPAETEEGALRAIVEAIGKAGDAAALAGLLAFRPRPVPDVVDGEIALSIGRLAYRGIRSRDGAAYAVRLLDLAGKGERWKAAYAMMRISDRDLLEDHASRIAAAAQDGDPEVRMYCAAALGKINEKRVALLTLLRLASEDSDWRVRVNALKALAGSDASAAPEAALALVQASEDSSRHISLTAIAALATLRLSGSEQEAAVRNALVDVLTNPGQRFSAQEQREAALSTARLFGADAYVDLRVLRQQGRRQMAAYAEALAFVQVDEARSELLELTRENDPRLLVAAVEALTVSLGRFPAAAPLREEIRNALVSVLRFDDVAVLAAAAAGLADSTLADRASVPYLLLALQRLRSPEHAEAMIAIAGALGTLKDRIAVPTLVALAREPDRSVAQSAVTALEAITGRPHGHLLRDRVAPETAPAEWGPLDWVRSHPDLLVRTSRGAFIIRLRPDLAPFTCMALATLVRRKFYDGLTFHRVVPNFVAQGGDPRGDGTGGPGFTIRSEFGSEHYETGTVGIASSGKDTEGSQFFVTHSRQPHLDGRYTIVGRVMSGMDAVDRIQIGDRIETMSFTAITDSAGNE